MAQKFGGAIGGAAVLWLLSSFGYVADNAGAVAQPATAISCLWWLMSFIPACVSAIAIFTVYFYPLTTSVVDDIVRKLKIERAGVDVHTDDIMEGKDDSAEDDMTDFANLTT